MVLDEQPGVIYLDFESDLDSEDPPTPLVHANFKATGSKVIELSDSSDDEEPEELQQPGLHSPPFQRSRVDGLNQQHLPASNNILMRDSMQAAINPERWDGSIAMPENPRLGRQLPPSQRAFPTYPGPPFQNEMPRFRDGQDLANPFHNTFSAPLPQVNKAPPTAARYLAEDNEIDFGMLLEDPVMLDFLTRVTPPPNEVPAQEGISPQNTVASISFEEALAIVLDVLPDVCIDFVRQIYDKRLSDIGHVDADALLTDMLMEKSYPKQKVSKKRKRGEGDPDEEQDGPIKEHVSRDQWTAASQVLRKRFATIPVQYINTVLTSKKTVYETMRTLMAVEKAPHATESPFRRLRRPRPGSIGVDGIGDDRLKAQFEAAYQKIALDESIAMQQQRKIEEDAEATKRAFELNDVSDCQCCFDTFPNAKMVVCDSETPHAFCTDCLTGHVKAQMELQKHEIQCMDTSSCKALFSRSTKQKALDTATFDRLERIEQQNVLRESGLDLDQCPFCDFAAICPPIEEDRELRCQAPDCRVVSCRLCKQKSHIPLTCEEHKKEQGVDERHIIEEEMTKAFLRMCPKCKTPIYKEGGCNKITCSVCHSFICDVCGKDITTQGYNHFGRGCPQSDERSGTARANERVKAAEQAAKQDVLAANPDLSAADLEIKMSEKLNPPAKENLRNYNAQLVALEARNRARAAAEAEAEAQRARILQAQQREREQEQERTRRAFPERRRVAHDDYAHLPDHDRQGERAPLEGGLPPAFLDDYNRRRLLQQQIAVAPVMRHYQFDAVPQEAEPARLNGIGGYPVLANINQPLAIPINPTAQPMVTGNNRANVEAHGGVYPLQNLMNPLMVNVRETTAEVAGEDARQAATQTWPVWPLTPALAHERPAIPQPLVLPHPHFQPTQYMPFFNQGWHQTMAPQAPPARYPGPPGEYRGATMNYRYTHGGPNEQIPLPQQL